MVIVAVFEHRANVFCYFLASVRGVENGPLGLFPVTIPSDFTRHRILKAIRFRGGALIVFFKGMFNEVCHLLN